MVSWLIVGRQFFKFRQFLRECRLVCCTHDGNYQIWLVFYDWTSLLLKADVQNLDKWDFRSKIAWHCFFKKRRIKHRSNTCNLCSRLFTKTAVICWSMNTNMVVSNAGILAASIVHHGFLPSGAISQSLWGYLVGWNLGGIFNLSVFTPNKASRRTMIKTDMITAKSLTTLRTW